MEAVSTSARFDALDFAKRTIRHEVDALRQLKRPTRYLQALTSGSPYRPAGIQFLAENQVSELPVVSAGHQQVGVIVITDVIGWPPTGNPLEKSPTLLPLPNESRDER